MTFNDLYAEHAATVLARCRRLVGPDDAADVAQQVWTNVWRHLASFRGTAKVSTWLYRVTHNAATDYHRRHARDRAGLQESFELSRHDRPARGRSPEAQAMFAQQRRALRRRLATLPPLYRRALGAWCETEALRAVAQQLGVPPGTIKSRLHRARQAAASSR